MNTQWFSGVFEGKVSDLGIIFGLVLRLNICGSIFISINEPNPLKSTGRENNLARDVKNNNKILSCN